MFLKQVACLILETRNLLWKKELLVLAEHGGVNRA